MRRTALAGAVILAVSLMLTACGTADGESDGAASEETAAPETPTDEMTDEMTDESTEPPTAEARSGDFERLNDKSVVGSVEVTLFQLTTLPAVLFGTITVPELAPVRRAEFEADVVLYGTMVIPMVRELLAGKPGALELAR